jgi:hypothetical protein
LSHKFVTPHRSAASGGDSEIHNAAKRVTEYGLKRARETWLSFWELKHLLRFSQRLKAVSLWAPGLGILTGIKGNSPEGFRNIKPSIRERAE